MSLPLLQSTAVAAAVCLNAAVWDAIATVLFSRTYTLLGLSAAFTSAAFQCLALSGVQPHVMAVANGAGAFVALVIANNRRGAALSPAQKTAAVLMVAGAAAGIAGIMPPESAVEVSRQRLLRFVAAAYCLSAVAAAPPAATWIKEGSHALRQLPRKWLLPVADAVNAAAFTACMALVSAASATWAVALLPVAGAVTLTSSVASLRVNSVTDHVCISYIGWCAGLLSIDVVGGYRFNIVLIVVQMTCFALALSLILNDPRKSAA